MTVLRSRNGCWEPRLKPFGRCQAAIRLLSSPARQTEVRLALPRNPRAPSFRTIGFATALLVAIGLAARLAPILEGPPRLFTQFPAEDGYLMLTIARDLAAGRGLTTAFGSIPTNGTQPLATLLYAGAFWSVDGDRLSGVRIVLLLETLFSLAVAGMLVGASTRAFCNR